MVLSMHNSHLSSGRANVTVMPMGVTPGMWTCLIAPGAFIQARTNDSGMPTDLH